MAYITPHNWVGGETATEALMDEINNNLRALFPVGKYGWLCRAATTAETFLDNCWLECNGVSVLRATYPDLNTLLSGLGYPFGTVDGTHMTLPDAQGRAPVSHSSGGHADVNALGDSDGVTKANRTPKHNTSMSGGSLSGSPGLSGAPGIGTLAMANHTHQDRGENHSLTPGSTPYTVLGNGSNAGPSGNPSTTALTGAPSIGTLAANVGTLSVSGLSGGPGGTRPIDQGTFLVVGTLFIKAVA